MLKKILKSREYGVSRARGLRQRETAAERVLWKKLRDRRFHGIKFRRQVPMGPFIVDFLSVELRLIIEIDGGTHFLPGAHEYDIRREKYLIAQGFKIIRFGHTRTLKDLDEVLSEIGAYIRDLEK